MLGLFGEYRGLGSPAALLLLVFGVSAQAGRSEVRGLRPLVGTMFFSAAVRRVALILAGIGWALLMALPASLVRLSAEPLLLAFSTGAAASLIAVALATLSRSAFAPRLVLLILWYGYFSSQ